LASEANWEFSYDSRKRAEVAQEWLFFIGFRITVLLSAVYGGRLFLSKKQYAAPQLALYLLLEQRATRLPRRKHTENAQPAAENKRPPEGGLV
jgi:hypothetical protein